jgi:hypothetical protein
VFRLYTHPGTSSPPRSSSPTLLKNETRKDIDDEVDKENHWARIEHKNSIITTLVEGQMNYAKAEEIAQEVQSLGCLLRAAENIGLDLKVRIRSNLYPCRIVLNPHRQP